MKTLDTSFLLAGEIINLTQHNALPEQVAAGVVTVRHDEIRKLLTFHEIPNGDAILARAKALAGIAVECNAKRAMIGGAPFLMAELERQLLEAGVYPDYAFSRREVSETRLPDGGVQKQMVFRHIGFVTGAADLAVYDTANRLEKKRMKGVK